MKRSVPGNAGKRCGTFLSTIIFRLIRTNLSRTIYANHKKRIGGALQSDAHLFHAPDSKEALEASVLPNSQRSGAASPGSETMGRGCPILLVVIVGLVIWLVHGQTTMTAEMTKFGRASWNTGRGSSGAPVAKE